MPAIPEVLVHICSEQDWRASAGHGEYRPPSLAESGFVHLSTVAQVHLPANRLYAGRRDLVLLYLDPHSLAAPLRWEPGVPTDPRSMVFPHLYGPLPTAAVTIVTPYLPGPDGRFGEPTPPTRDGRGRA
ncbi:DUF952 domain-containing protein [Mycolicibacterium palauense]|uniref:DUF952 domain-containing protein n=1 Tax=Mycolicibacterium palauense TaxID=2034511 RepID=UPI000BFEFC34|nr:DUF952 domain-containing protein [Mycolicibacterium palauense]